MTQPGSAPKPTIQPFLEVAPIPNEPLRYWVSSQKQGQPPYVVDLSMNEGSGACVCTDFITRRQPAVNMGKQLFTDQTSCKHVRAARNYFTERTLRDMAQMLNKNQG